MTLPRKLMLGMAVLIVAVAVMTVIGGSIEAATTSAGGTSKLEMEFGGEPRAAVATADICESSTILHAPMALTTVGTDPTGQLGGSSPESGGPCQTVVECTLTHWGWYCVVYIVCP
ncbi:MAG: hypothetical protein OXH19_05715 [Chloroflexi bacterium]|nr:hypothetical protein [Chloroflexota bacterium]MCY3587606.1 hypothetical protein [Chloroflexota bacterium]MCY3685751.1 hypothetical protein [Chloroflexota bacterium]MDE2708028.1 hypothetical protein [Chloroflexota bacterium]